VRALAFDAESRAARIAAGNRLIGAPSEAFAQGRASAVPPGEGSRIRDLRRSPRGERKPRSPGAEGFFLLRYALVREEAMSETLRTETRAGVRHVVLTRAAEYNTITPTLRHELAAAIDAADDEPEVHAILLRAEGPAFCAGYALDWGTAQQAAETTHEIRARASASAPADESRPAQRGEAERRRARASASAPADESRPAQRGEAERRRVWDSVADHRMMSRFVDTYMKLWYARKPTLAAVQGWCIGGGTDLVLCADLVIAGEGARFGYPPARVWGTPTTAMWVYRMGLEQAKRYLLTGDEISAAEAARIGMILETVPDADLLARASALAERMARLPTNQLVMLKLLCNQTAEHMGLGQTRLLGTLFDGIARHTQEGLDFVARAQDVGFRQAVRERDDPFGDYGSRRKP
jgi:enoyl-CoA hydratase